MKYVLGVVALIYIVFPTGGLVEFAPDFLPIVGHLDELAATFLLTRVFDRSDGTEAPPSWFELMAFVILGAAGAIYLFLPTAGIVEFIPDIVPIAGNIDEMLASMLVFAMTSRVDRASYNRSSIIPSNTDLQLNREAYASMSDTPENSAATNNNTELYSFTSDTQETAAVSNQQALGTAYQQPIYTSAQPPPQGQMQPPNFSQTVVNQRSNTFCLQIFAGFALVLLICGGVFIGAIVAGGNALSDIFDFGFLPDSLVSVDYSQPIVNSLSASATLVTYEGIYTIDEVRVNYQGGVLNAAGFGMTFEVDAELSAGFDLRDDTAFTVTRQPGNRYIVQLPVPELAQCSITDVDIEDRSMRLLRTITEQEMEQLARFTAMDGMIDKALQQGLFTEAMREARVVVGRIVRQIAGEDATIEIQFAEMPDPLDATTVVRDNTCFVEPPTRFSYDPEEDVWQRN